MRTLIIIIISTIGFYGNNSNFIKKYSPPFKQEDFINVKSYFGKNYNPLPINYKPRNHKGIVVELKNDAPIISIDNGTIRKTCDNCSKTKGKLVEIEYENELVVKYYHLGKISVKEGEKIHKNQIIGISGQTGMTIVNSIGIQTIKSDQIIDPLKILEIRDEKQEK